jgi:type I restriction enzyme S subunit
LAWPILENEQRAIAAALSDVDALISALDRLIDKKRAVKTAAMQQLLTGKQRLPGFSGEWEVKRLGDVIERIVGGGTPSRANPTYWGNEIPWVTVKDFATFDPNRTQEAITREGLERSASNLIPKGTVITSTRMAVGKAVVYEVDVSINQDLKALFPKQCVDSQFLYFWFDYHAATIESLESGSTVKGISLQDLKNIEFLQAPLAEQRAIAAVLSDMDAEIEALEARREKTRQVKQGMMQELLTGRTRLVRAGYGVPDLAGGARRR